MGKGFISFRDIVSISFPVLLQLVERGDGSASMAHGLIQRSKSGHGGTQGPKPTGEALGRDVLKVRATGNNPVADGFITESLVGVSLNPEVCHVGQSRGPQFSSQGLISEGREENMWSLLSQQTGGSLDEDSDCCWRCRDAMRLPPCSPSSFEGGCSGLAADFSGCSGGLSCSMESGRFAAHLYAMQRVVQNRVVSMASTRVCEWFPPYE